VEATYLNDDVTVELICDGKHCPKQCMQLALKIKGADKVIGITDATRIACTDEKDGILGSIESGTRIVVDDGVAKLPDLSSYAGSICTMDRALRVLCVDYGIGPVVAARMLSTAPAKLFGCFDTIGEIRIGKHADLVITDERFNIKTVIKGGMPV
jgi:N-acetylglucosamine-6-phosphate deacetylase